MSTVTKPDEPEMKMGWSPAPRRTKPKQIKGSMPVRSIRVSDVVWNRARKRAKTDGVTLSHALALFAEGYGDGHLKLPRLELVYDDD